MPDEKVALDGDKKGLAPLETFRLDKTVMTVVSLHEADALDKAYWAA